MKIITVTSQKAYNYGAVLQAYALQQTLFHCGYENELLNHTTATGVKRRGSIKVRSRDMLLSALNLLHHKEYNRFCNNFKEFEGKYLRSTKQYQSVDAVFNNPPAADMYLTGSDQVFALGNSLVPLRFLEFGAYDIPRVSYAASLGSYTMTQRQLSYVNNRLRVFSSVSMREKQGSNYLNTELGLNCQTHIDPVFLLTPSQWDEIIPEKSRIEGEYILCFPMLNNAKLQYTIDKLKKETGLPVISVQTKFFKTVKADKYLYDVSVPEFLWLIKNASAVITTSFHCTAFSVLFQRPIYSLVGSYKPERVQNLFNLIGMPERVISEDSVQLPSLDINYTAVDSIISKERTKAFEYLNGLRNLLRS